MKIFALLLLALPLVGCGSSSDEAPVMKGDPPPVVAGTPLEHHRGGKAASDK